MPAFLIFAASLLHVAYAEAVLIVVLLLLILRLGVVGARGIRQRDRARRERDEAKASLATIRRMSEIRVEAVTRLRGFAQEP